MSNLNKLLTAINQYCEVHTGTVSVGKDGVIYRYDRYVLRYKYTSKWLEELFNKAGTEVTGQPVTGRQFTTENISFHIDKSPYIGVKTGKLIASKLVILT